MNDYYILDSEGKSEFAHKLENNKNVLLFTKLKKGGFRRWVKVAKNQKLSYTHGMGTWKSKNRHKYLLQYHIIFVCKYRKKLPVSRQISDDIKQFSYEICQRHSVIIRYMEKISPIFTKTILERTYLLDRWIFCL